MEALQLIEKNSSVTDAARKKLQKGFFFFSHAVQVIVSTQ